MGGHEALKSDCMCFFGLNLKFKNISAHFNSYLQRLNKTMHNFIVIVPKL